MCGDRFISNCLPRRNTVRTLRRVQEHTQIQWYLPVLMLVVVASAMAFGMLIASWILGRVLNKWRGKDSAIKNTAYECGMLPVGEGSTRLSVKFYLVAMLFILFDVEVVFMYPWATVYSEMLKNPATKNLILGSMVSFLVILFIGYVYALKKKAFEWKR
jgi:NADH-quinone oxidoreductase subunit A